MSNFDTCHTNQWKVTKFDDFYKIRYIGLHILDLTNIVHDNFEKNNATPSFAVLLISDVSRTRSIHD